LYCKGIYRAGEKGFSQEGLIGGRKGNPFQSEKGGKGKSKVGNYIGGVLRGEEEIGLYS